MSTEPKIADLLMFAIDAARLGGELALSWAGSRETAAKLDASPVTAADHAVQAAILDRVAQRFPDHAVLVEETLLDSHRHSGRDAEYCWVVDPIDGTRNFARGSRSFATSVALLQHGRPLVGAIYDGRNGTICYSGRGRGGFCTQEKQSAMHVTNVPLDPRSVIAISSFHGMPMPPAIRALIDVVFLRSLGSLCLHLVGVASGDFDALHSQDAKLWDIAAGTLLIEEAGGVVTHPDGRPLWPVDVAAYSGEDLPLMGGGPRIHADLVARLRETDSHSR